MNIPENIFYTKDHEWARFEGETVYVGITNYAQGSLGDITFIELPKVGEKLIQSKYCATVESVKAASEVYAPLSGIVVSINQELVAHPELINKSVYKDGYFFTIELTNEAEKSNLMNAALYKNYVEGIAK